jgi:putative glutamine amidotransferase
MSGATAGGRPVIGVTSSRRAALVTMWLNRLALWRAGARSVRLHPGKEVALERLDGCVIGGGDDIDVSLYDKELKLETRIDPERDALEQRVLDYARHNAMPVLGICRGAQMINVHLGGTLYTNVRETFSDFPKTRSILATRHVTATASSLLSRLFGRERFKVNSLHNQSIHDLGRGVQVVARDEYGVVQAIETDAEVPDPLCAIGVQWHPEFLVLDRRQQGLFRWLVKRAAARRESGGSAWPGLREPEKRREREGGEAAAGG